MHIDGQDEDADQPSGRQQRGWYLTGGGIVLSRVFFCVLRAVCLFVRSALLGIVFFFALSRSYFVCSVVNSQKIKETYRGIDMEIKGTLRNK